MPIQQSWRRRGHSPDCWRHHEECALRSAKDVCETRIAQARAQSLVCGTGLQKLNDGLDHPGAVELARKILQDYHQMLRVMARDER